VTVSKESSNEEIIGFLENVSGQLYIPCKKVTGKDGFISALKKIREKYFLPNSFENYLSVSKIASIVDIDDMYEGKQKDSFSIIFMDYIKNKIERPKIKWLNADEAFEMNDSNKIEPYSWHVLKNCFFHH
tara:strand:+ start:1044 stop:1433 length:390 start_codon:yes stop_codon:yes gene_type:complete